MKRRGAMRKKKKKAPQSTRPCQRPGCLSEGQLRSQGSSGKRRTVYLCTECFAKLRADQLRDLFVRFAGNGN